MNKLASDLTRNKLVTCGEKERERERRRRRKKRETRKMCRTVDNQWILD